MLKEIDQIIERSNAEEIAYDLFDSESVHKMMHSWIIQSSDNTYKPSKSKKKKKKMKDPQNQEQIHQQEEQKVEEFKEEKQKSSEYDKELPEKF